MVMSLESELWRAVAEDEFQLVKHYLHKVNERIYYVFSNWQCPMELLVIFQNKKCDN